MKEQLLEQLLPMIEKTKEGMLSGIEMLQEQTPLLVEEIYRWELAIGIIGVVIGMGLLTIFAWMLKNRKELWEKLEKINAEPVYILGSVISLLSGTVFFFVNLCKVIQIAIAPKLYLVYYITKLLSGK